MENLLAFGSSDIDAIESGAGINSPDNLASIINSPTAGRLSIVSILFFIAGAFFVFYLISGGIKMMTSAGDPRSVGEAKQTITNALVGLVIVLGAYWIVQLAGIILGLPGIQNTFR